MMMMFLEVFTANKVLWNGRHGSDGVQLFPNLSLYEHCLTVIGQGIQNSQTKLALAASSTLAHLFRFVVISESIFDSHKSYDILWKFLVIRDQTFRLGAFVGNVCRYFWEIA